MKIYQTNLQHKHLATATLRKQLEVDTEAIALIQEPWARANRVCGLGNCDGKIFYNSSQEPPRTCIYIPRCITATQLTQYCYRDLTAVQLQNGTKPNNGLAPRPIVLASLYLPIEDQIPPKEVTDLVNHCEEHNIDLIISVDSNAHHTLWGSISNNKRGEQLLSYLLTTNLTIINRGTEPTFVSSRYQTIIDLTLASHNVAAQIKNWHVCDEPSLSDHRRICYELNLTRTQDTPRRNPRKTNRKLYKTLIAGHVGNKELREIRNVTQIDQNVENLTENIKTCYEQACPLQKRRTKQVPLHSWWGPDLERKRQKLRRLFNRAKNTRRDEDWDNFREAQARYKTIIRDRENKSWQQYCTNIESYDTANKIRKILAEDTNTTLGSLRKADQSYTKDDKEVSATLIETHFPGCRIVDTPEWADETQIIASEADWEIAHKIVTQEKVRWAIDTFQPFKSAGTDQIFPALLQWGADIITPWLVDIYSACLALKYIPLKWREVKVVFLPKPGKNDYTEPKSYRPISLTSFLLKTLERLGDRFLRDRALKHIPIHQNQHAYSTGKSTETALHGVVCKIEHDLQNKLSTLGAFIDIEGAFDKTTFRSIDKALDRHEVPETLRNWIGALLEKRVIQVNINGTMKGIVAKGCPQGGVLSPILWNLVVDDLITKMNNNGFFTIGYADDITILISGKHENTLSDIMQNALRCLEKWCKDNKLTVNPKKTELVLFTNKRKTDFPKTPKLFSTSLTLSSEVKYLGVILDSKLNWKKHLDTKIQRATIILAQCKRMIGRSWGLKPHIMKWLYLSVIRSAVTYASVVWWPRTLLKTAQLELQKFQRQACLAITSCMSTTPSNALEIILGIPPLHLYIREMATLAALRLKCYGLWKQSNTTHTRILTSEQGKYPKLGWICDKTQKEHIIEKDYQVHFEDNTTQTPSTETIEVYTDGSKTSEGTGAGVYCPELNIHIASALGKDNTVFQAECVGITAAANALATRQVTNFNININSDSKSVLKALARNTASSKLVLGCHKALQNISKSNRVSLRWVKGHSGNLGNDAADELARRASTLRVMGPEPIVPIPFCEYKSWLRKQTESIHAELWANTADCRQTKEAIPSPNPELTHKLLELNRRKLRMVVGTITGHCTLNKHLSILGITDSPLCRACMESDETPDHVLLRCRGVSTQREAYMGSPATLPEVLADLGGLLGLWGELGWLE